MFRFKTSIVFGIFCLCFISPSCEGADDTSGFTPEQSQKIAQFREIIQHFDHLQGPFLHLVNTSFASSYLAARDFNVEVASKDLLEVLDWRHKNKIDRLAYLPDFYDPREYPYDISSVDADGRPVIFGKVGDWDVRRAILSANKYNISAYLLQIVEKSMLKLIQLNKETGRDVSKVILIVDFSGYNLRQHGCIRCLVYYEEWAVYYEKYLRGFVKHMIAVNVPRIFAPIIRILWPFGTEHTKSILRIYGPNRDVWQKALREIIPLDQLPIEYGGAKIRKAIAWNEI